MIAVLFARLFFASPTRALMAVMMVIALVVSPTVHANETVVFGPETFERRFGWNVTEKRQLPANLDFDRYVLRVYNGGFDGNGTTGHKIWWGFIRVNDRTVVNPFRFSRELRRGNALFFDTPISKPEHFSVTIRGRRGAEIAVAIIGISDDPTAGDNDAPTITAAVSPAANSNGWHNQNVSVSFNCTDAGSGIASCSNPVTVSETGAGQVVTGVAVDRAQNQAETTVSVSLDKVLPHISSQTSAAANGAGWHNQTVSFSYSCSDAHSGVAACSEAQTLTVEGANQTLTGQATDRAGNTAVISNTVNVDLTPPSITSQFNLIENAAGWYKQPITVNYECSDALSGIATCPQAQVVAAEGVNQAIVGEAVDAAGNTAVRTDRINLDATPPTLGLQVSPEANGAGWHKQAVTVEPTCEDTLSGVAHCSPAITIATEGADQTVEFSATDHAGNAITSALVLKIDTTAPTIEFTAPAAGATVASPRPAVALVVADNLSLDAGALVLTANGTALAGCTVANELVSCNLVADLPVGEVTLQAQVRDSAGNFASVSHSITVPEPVIDSDGDGVLDDEDAFPNDPTETVDTDSDGIGNNADTDDDGDGVIDSEDAFPLDFIDSSDLDGDGIGDNRDEDRDGDGVNNDDDAFPSDPAETIDTDNDGIGNNADLDDDGDSVNDADDVFPLDAAESADLDGDGIGDNADPDRDGDGVNNEDDYFPDDANASSVPTVQITSPATLITVGSSPITVTGTIDDPAATLVINGVQVPHNSGVFSAAVALEEGANTIIVRAIDANNHEGTATIAVSLDRTPPYITFESPQSGDVVYSETVAVSGLVNDIVRGTVSENDAVVTVNGRAATVANRSYLAENITLQAGANTITVTATDAVGNEATETITVTYQPQRDRQMTVVSGQAQTAAIQQSIDQPLVVQLMEAGEPVAEKNVVFRVIQGDGLLQPGTDKEGSGVVVQTDANGQAQVNFKLGTRAGNGNQKVRARAVGFDGEAIFYASATFGEGAQVGVIEGNNQRGSVRQPLAKPLVVAVTDVGANLIPNVQIEFSVIKGGGHFNNGESTFVTTTDTDGRASATFVLGPEEGLDVQRVTATLVGTSTTAGFTASGFLPGDPGQTAISGVILDNQDQPVPGVTVRVDGSSRQAVADAQGQFTITEAPVGPVHLLVEGSTTSRAGEWPSLSYNIVTVPGVNNPMASPIYLVQIDTENAVMVGAEDTVVTHKDIPGFALEVAAGSVTFPDGSKSGQLSITRVNANKMPMPPPNGMQPQLIVTIQPHGAKFDPPAKMTIPNTDGHAPGAQVEMYSYDHDLEEFVTIGLGTVSTDGASITSNDGSGVIKAGWHCGSQPGGSGCCESPPSCSYCEDPVGECPGGCELIPERPAQNQIKGNCQSELCGGNEMDDSDVPEDDVEFDCKMPGCENGNKVELNDDSDISEDDAKCNKCEEGELTPDNDDQPCGEGPDEACLVCSEGKCGPPDCDASDVKQNISLSSNEVTTKFFERLSKAGSFHPLFEFEVKPFVKGTVEVGEECCKDCSVSPPKKGKYQKFSGALGAELSAAVGPSRSIDRRWRSPAEFGYSYDFEVKASIRAQFGARGDIGGSINGKANDICGEGCISVNGSAQINVFAEAGAKLDEFDLELKLAGKSLELIDVEKPEISVGVETGAIGITVGSSYGDGQCDAGCEISWGSLKAVVTLSGGSVEVFDTAEFSLPTYAFEYVFLEEGKKKCD